MMYPSAETAEKVRRREMIEEIRTQVAENLKDLDGVVALRQTEQGTAPYLFPESGMTMPNW